MLCQVHFQDNFVNFTVISVILSLL